MVDLFDKPFHGFVNFSHHVTSQGNSVDAIEKSALKLMKVPNLKVINDLTLMAPSSGIRHYLIAGHFNKSTEEKPCRTWLWVTAVEFKSHAHPALRVVMWNNLDKPGCNRIKPVYHWREVVTVTIKHLNNKNEKKKNNNNNKIRATKIISEKKKIQQQQKTPENYYILGRSKRAGNCIQGVECLYFNTQWFTAYCSLRTCFKDVTGILGGR